MNDIISWALLMVKVVIAALVIMLIFALYKFMFGFKHNEFSRVALTSSSESDMVVTSFAQVDLLFLKKGKKEILIPSQETITNYEQVVNKSFDKADQFCLHSYELAFGYPSLKQERNRDVLPNSAPVREPEVVAINTLRSENAPDSSTKWCQRKNLKTRRDALKKEIEFALKFDEVLYEHLTHGQMVLASILDLADKNCRPISSGSTSNTCYTNKLNTWWRETSESNSEESESITKNIIEQKNSLKNFSSEEEKAAFTLELSNQTEKAFNLKTSAEAQKRASDKGGDVASIVLTFSSTIGVSQERKRFLGLWNSKRFYLQRDIAKVYYGTNITPKNLQTTWNPFSPNRVVLEFNQPDIMAIDRYSSFIATRNKIEKKNKSHQSLSNYLNMKVVENLEDGINRFHSRAVKAAENILISRIPSYFDVEEMSYQVKFQRPSVELPKFRFSPGVLDLVNSEVEGNVIEGDDR